MTSKGSLALLLATFACLLGSAPAHAQEDAAGETSWYAERLTTGDAPVRLEHLWSKGDRLRSENTFMGHPIVNLVADGRYVVFDRLSRRGISIARSPLAIAQDADRERPFANELAALRSAGAEQVGSERVGTSRCDIWRLTNQEGRREVCVSEGDAKLPLWRKIWVRNTGRESLSRYLEWSRDLQLPDAFFQVPADVELEQLTYEAYLERAPKERLGPSPPMHRELLHGTPE